MVKQTEIVLVASPAGYQPTVVVGYYHYGVREDRVHSNVTPTVTK